MTLQEDTIRDWLLDLQRRIVEALEPVGQRNSLMTPGLAPKAVVA